MMSISNSKYQKNAPRSVFATLATYAIICAAACGLLFGITQPARAQEGDTPQVQIINGSITSGEIRTYSLVGLHQGDKLYARVNGTSGNLDPFIALLSREQMAGIETDSFDAAVNFALENNQDPLLVVDQYAGQNFLHWDDDSGGGFSAAMEFTIPSDGNFNLIVLSSPFTQSFGDYELVVGLNAPEVLSGNPSSKGADFVLAMDKADTKYAAVQEINGAVGATTPSQRHRLIPFKAGDSLYVFVETLEGDLIPQVVLRAYGTKPIRTANIAGDDQQAILQYTFPAETQEYLIEIIPTEDTSGSYRLIVGRNEPAVLVGETAPYGEALLQQPIDASVGVYLQQISNIDQKAENYEAVASTLIQWHDPALAFRADECECESKVYTANDFITFATRENLVWPAFTYLNQQNNRWIQNEYVMVEPNGDAVYFERFTTTFQAPDFNFRTFPFDTQTLYIRLDSVYATPFVQFSESDFTRVGTQLGEEEWYVTDWETEVFAEPSSTGAETSSFVFRFFASRHLSFYIYRIFVPLLLIITVTWISFFMADYGKRVDATTANLLLFIAFNFTIADELPRLGYLTFMDTLLVGAFFISVIVVIYNVILNRQAKRAQEHWAIEIDKYMIWLYPLVYAIAFTGITWSFFGQ